MLNYIKNNIKEVILIKIFLSKLFFYMYNNTENRNNNKNDMDIESQTNTYKERLLNKN
jgi:hypothetical protein